MLLALKLAYRNLVGAGLRTWLNVIVLSFSFVVIIWMKGIMVGWDHQAKTDTQNWEIAGGQYWHENYDQFDPFTLTESHAPVPESMQEEIDRGDAMAILVTQGTIYPEGRMQSILIKGISPQQTLLHLPTQKLDTTLNAIPAVIGSHMAKVNNLEIGDFVTIQWRDVNGTFDASEIFIADIFSTNVPTVDGAQVWISLEKLQSMMLIPGEATMITFRDSDVERADIDNWTLKTQAALTANIDEIIKTKTVGQSVFYFILLLLAMLAIFDTQVLSIFRRQREIGTIVALGFTKRQVVWLFTTEGAMHSILAAVVAAIYGIPFLWWQAKTGWTMPVETSDYGMAIAQTLYPKYTLGLIIGTTLIVVITTTIVSYWPSRKIAKMNPTQAIKGKIQ
ncbi:MAG: ABC transporter permease [Bacteroidetes bacterium]|nr:MAG: ABC transporter permease [Bacteroidota bacterium]